MEKCTISTILCIFARKWPSQMSRKITTLAPALLRVHAPQSNDIYASEDIAILRSLRPLMSSSAVELIHTPQLVDLGRILLVTGGKAVHQINLVPFETQPGDVLVIPQNTYISLSSLSDDYEGQMISFDHLSVDFEKCVHLRLKEDDFRRIRHYVDLLWETVHSKFDRKSVEHLETALLYDLKHLHTDQSGSMLSGLSRSQLIFQRFMDALGRKEPLPRSVKAYAEEVCVSPNYLSAIVKQQSGRSVMDWLNAHAILRAQVLLRHTDLPIYEVADRLDFQCATFFSRFFKRETGVTPREYRNGGRPISR